MIIVSKSLIKVISFNFAKAMAIYPFILVNDKMLKQDAVLVNHEKIHLRQQIELLIIFFYLLYALEYVKNFLKYKNHRLAYLNISFEKEAFTYEKQLDYLQHKKWFSFVDFW